MKKTNKFPNETIDITPECNVHLHSHQNKMVPLLKPSILVALSNGAKFHNCTYWLIIDTQSHRLPRQINNHHIKNENLIFLNHVEIGS
jgi:hypothetical protein